MPAAVAGAAVTTKATTATINQRLMIGNLPLEKAV
jgi:hypothetical protein